MSLTFCHRCGASLVPGARFCGECGAPSKKHARSRHAELLREERRDTRHVAAVAIVFVGVLGGMLLLSGWADALGGAEAGGAVVAFVAQLAAGLVACAVLGDHALRRSLAGAPRAPDVGLGVLVGVGGYAISWTYVQVLAAASDIGDPAGAEPVGVALAFAVVVGAPLVEEWADRGILWHALRPLTSTVGVIVTSSALFALLHGLNGGFVLELPHRFVVGLGLGWLRARSDSLVPGIVAHAVLNGLSVAPLIGAPS